MSASATRRRGASDLSRVVHKTRDARTFSQKAKDWVRDTGVNGPVVAFGLLALVCALVFFPIAAPIAVPGIYFFSRKYLHPKLSYHNHPFRVAKHFKVPDGSKKNNKNPGELPLSDVKMMYGDGTNMWGIGTEPGAGEHEQLWLSQNDTKTHLMVLGGTGSGKTEFLYNLVFNQLTQDSGFIYVDVKGDILLQGRIIELLHRFDRFEDLLTITFAVGNRDLSAAHTYRITNTFNIMSSASDAMLIEVISGMVSNDSAGKDVWEGRCLALVAALTRPLVFLRNKGQIDLSPSTYINYLELSVLEDLAFGNKTNSIKGFKGSAAALLSYFSTLPGWLPSKKGRQEQKTLEQHGYITMQLTRVFNDLGYNYGHIFDARVGEVDISDVVLNRRCLTVLLPSLERSGPTLLMLGKLLMNSVKQMMASSLGANVEGARRLIIDARPTNARNVFRCLLDEVGYIMVPGMAVMPAQARSLNIAMTFAAQTYSDIKKGDALEAEAIWGNTSIKVIGRLMGGSDQSSDTWNKLHGLAGTVDELQVSGYYRDDSVSGFSIKENSTYSLTKQSRIELEHMQSLENGEFVFFGAKKEDGGKSGLGVVFTFQSTYVASESPPIEMRINDLVPISKAGNLIDNTAAKTKFLDALKEGGLHKLMMDAAMPKTQFGAEKRYKDTDVNAFVHLCMEVEKVSRDALDTPFSVVYYSLMADALNKTHQLSDKEAFDRNSIMYSGG